MTGSVPPQRAWRLAKGDRVAEAFVTHHPLGPDAREVRYTVDGELVRSEVFRGSDGVSKMLIDLEQRKAEFEAKGWIEQ